MGVMYMLVVLVVGVSAFVPRQPEPSPCCVPDKYEQWAHNLDGMYNTDTNQPEIFRTNVHISYDANEQKVAMSEYMHIGSSEHDFKMILDFANSRVYNIDKAGQCTFRHSSVTFERRCVPSNAKYIATGHLGSDSTSNQLMVNCWNITDADGSFVAIMTTTAVDCIPVGEHFVRAFTQDPMAGGAQYTHYSAGIQDPSVFDPPSNCQPGSMKVSKFMRHLGSLYSGREERDSANNHVLRWH